MKYSIGFLLSRGCALYGAALCDIIGVAGLTCFLPKLILAGE